MPSTLEKLKKIFGMLLALQVASGKAVSFFEKLENAHNFSSVPISIICFTAWLIAGTGAAALIASVPLSWIYCIGGCIVLTPFLIKQDEVEQQQTSRPLPQLIRAAVNIVGRVPAAPAIAHRSFCAEQQLEGEPPASKKIQ
jgi:hypothetical protein